MSAGVTIALGAALLLFASIYLGMGWSLVAFQFPGALGTTRATNFPERFGAPVRRAVGFFSVVSVLMVIGSVALTWGEWDDGSRRYLPLVYGAFVVIATAFTVIEILPVNKELSREIGDEQRFTQLLRRWITLNVIRAGLWVVEWVAIVAWFVVVARDGVA